MPHEIGFGTESFRVMTPRTAQGAAFEKNRGADAGTILGTELLEIKDQTGGHADYPLLVIDEVVGGNRDISAISISSNRMGFPGNNLILDLFPQTDKIGVVAGDPHQKVVVFIREFLGLPEGVGVDHIDLQTSSSYFSIGP
jgi:hypothetical protein